MRRQRIFVAIATAALFASPTLADPGGGQGGGQGGGHGGGGGDGPTGGVSDMGSTMREMGRENSQGPDNANSRAIERANENSVLSDSTSPTTTMNDLSSRSQLTGVTTGMTVVNSSGATIGTVTDINMRGNGSVKNVEVTLSSGEVVRLKSKTLSLDAGVLTASSIEGQAANRRVNSQGPAHASARALERASPNSVLASAGVTTLTGLNTGLTVNNSGGAAIGTVSSIVTNRSGAVVGINVALAGGGTVFIPATTLSMDGTIVITSSANL